MVQRRLAPTVRDRLVDELVKFDSVREIHSRHLYEDLLPSPISSMLVESRSVPPRQFALDLVQECQRHAGGLRALIDALRSIHPTTVQLATVEELLRPWVPSPLLEPAERARLHQLIDDVPSPPNLLWLYHVSVGPVGPSIDGDVSTLIEVVDHLEEVDVRADGMPPLLVFVENLAWFAESVSATEVSAGLVRWNEDTAARIGVPNAVLVGVRDRVRRRAVEEGRVLDDADSATIEPSAPRWVVPAFAGETTRGRDLLGIQQDATALAVLLASTSLTPPLALGLYGEWGSGKTFLMRALDQEIQRLTESGIPEFRRRVRSVWFNAWHYAEGNLWASLVHHIFLSLHGDGPKPRQALDEALAKLQGIQDAKAQAAENVDSARQATSRAREDLGEIEAQYQKATSSAAEVTAQDVWAVISVDPGLRQDLDRAVEELRLPAVGNSARDIAHAVDEVRSAVGRGRVLATTAPLWKSPLVLGLLASVVVSVAGLVLSSVVNWSHTWLAPMVAAVSQLAAVGSGAASGLARQATIVRALLEPAERIQRHLDERLADAEAKYRADNAIAQQRLAKTEAKLIAAQQQLAAAETAEATAQAELRQLTGPRLLERYLSERLSSGDYRQYLGVVALAHRDLRDLDDHLQAAATTADDGDSGIDRIVLYVDDLDRCPPETVVRVLEAVHLLLALPLFVVVVGVDVRWLVRSLRQRHRLLPEPDEPAVDLTPPATPTDYLDKIFQLTYQLPVMTPERCADLLHYTAMNDGQSSAAPRQASKPKSPVNPVRFSDTAGRAEAEVAFADDTENAAALQLDQPEREALPHVATLVASSPRRAKRFLNVYRICKARALADPPLRKLLNDDASGLLLLTALTVGLPQLIPQAFDTCRSDDESNLRAWLQSNTRDISPQSAEFQRLTDFLAVGEQLLDLPVSRLTPWLPVVRRFAWPVVNRR